MKPEFPDQTKKTITLNTDQSQLNILIT